MIVTTGTASGKSLCFNLPTLDVLCARPPRARALPLPDQGAGPGPGARAARAAAWRGIRPAIYDGDTPREERAAIRAARQPRPHQPRHAARRDPAQPPRPGATSSPTSPWSWSTRRTSTAACSAPTWPTCCGACGGWPRPTAPSRASCSPRATIANPVELAERLTGLDDVRAGRPRRRARAPSASIAMWNPPLLDEALGARGSALARGGRPARRPRAAGARGRSASSKSRRAVELIQRFTAAAAAEDGDRELAERVAPYRAGYTPAAAARARAAAGRGELLGVVATDALELGIDIGELDAAICVTFPGTVASLRQMWGRAGRRGRGLAVYVAGEDALDQFFCRHPDEFLDRPVEAAILDHESRGDPPRAPAVRGARGAAGRGRRRVRSARAGEATPSGS